MSGVSFIYLVLTDCIPNVAVLVTANLLYGLYLIKFHGQNVQH